MHELLERLGRGDTQVLEMCRKANQAWLDFFQELETADTGTISARLGFFQRDFHKIFGNSAFGDNMMAWTGFAALYETNGGFGARLEKARQLAEAFSRSNCSEEVRSEARSAIISYGLEAVGAAPAQQQPYRR